MGGDRRPRADCGALCENSADVLWLASGGCQMIAVQMKVGPRIADLRAMDLPYTLRLYGVTDAMFDELVDEDTRAELIDGVMIVHSPASIKHDNLSGFLRFLMRGFSEATDAGIVLGPDSLIRLRRGRRVGPDLFFLEK